MTRTLDRKTILLFGTGRSGTTWLASILANPFRYRLLFEPFHPNHVNGAKLVADRYFSPGDIPNKAKNFVHKAINDEINNKWIAQSSNRKLYMHRWRFWPKVRICKCVRGNLLIPALRKMYDADLPIIVLMRHPGAVIESFMRVKFPWGFDVDRLLAQDKLQKEYQTPLRQLADYSNSNVGKLAIRWVIENAYLFKYAKELGINIVYYENLVSNPIKSIQQICNQLDLVVSKKLPELIEKPSYTTHPRSPLYSESSSQAAWIKKFELCDVNLIEAILNEAGVNYIIPEN